MRPQGNLGNSITTLTLWKTGEKEPSSLPTHPVTLLLPTCAWVVSCYTWCFSKRPWKQPSLPKERQKKTITTELRSRNLFLNSYTSLFQSFRQRSQDTRFWSFPLLFCFLFFSQFLLGVLSTCYFFLLYPMNLSILAFLPFLPLDY